MKLRYKKIIAMVTVCTMGIGMITFSITRQEQNKSTGVENKVQSLSADNLEAADVLESASADVSAKAAVSAASLLPGEDLSPTPTVTEDAEADSDVLFVANNPLEKSTNKELNTLIKKYLNAKLGGKVDDFKSLVDNTDLIDIKDINRKAKYIDKYENIESYIKTGPEEGSYAVYVYYDLKFSGIDTAAPGMIEYYVKTGDDGKLFINLSKNNADTTEYLKTLREAQDVADMIDSVDTKFEKVRKKDESLAAFYTKLEDSAKTVSSNE
ncbi:MAG: hypothetical protein K0R05_4088 [Anaerocolumna sp.]|jgi:hypothetical protein|nr:hypothetical protein [Anaerocolumna sp.]